MAAEIGNDSVWSQTDASNASGTSPSWSGAAAPSTLDDSGRAMMGAIKREWAWRSLTVTSSGADTKTLTYSVAPAAYYTGQQFAFINGTVNTTTSTLNVNTLGAKTIKKDVSGTMTVLAAGDMPAGARVIVMYDGTDMIWVNRGQVVDLTTYAALAGTTAFSAVQTIGIDNAGTNTVTDILKLKHTSSGTAAASFGAGLLYQLEDGGGTTTDAASIDAVWVDATDTSEDSKISFKTMVAGVAKAEAGFIAAGLVMGSPTGGDKGAGTINATSLYLNGTALSATSTPTVVLKAADETVSTSTTVQSDDDFTFTAAASTNYLIRIRATVTTSGTGGLKISHTGPSTPTAAVVSATLQADSAVTGTTMGFTSTSYTGNVQFAFSAGTAVLDVTIVLKNGSTSAAWALQWAQASSNGNTKLLANSVMEYRTF